MFDERAARGEEDSGVPDRRADEPSPVPPSWMAEEPERTDEEWALAWAAVQASECVSPMPDRFEALTGVPWQPVVRLPDGPVTEVVAAVAQDAAVAAAEVLQLAEAHRVAALLVAYEAAVEDLQARFGAKLAARGGLGVAAFFTSMGLQLRQHPRRIAHEVDTAMTVRDRLPRLWGLFLGGGASWARVDLAARLFEGLDRQHWAAYDEAAVLLVRRSSRLKRDLHHKREALQADTAARRARSTFERRTTTLELGHDGEASLVVTGLAAALIACSDAIHAAAVAAHGVPGETRGVGQLRHDIALDVLIDGLRQPAVFAPDNAGRDGDGGDGRSTSGEPASPSRSGAMPPRTVSTDPGATDSLTGAGQASPRVPWRKAVTVQLVLTVPALAWLGKSEEQAVLGGYGPIAMEVAKDLAGDARSFVRVLTDPHTGVRLAMGRRVYTAPADLARWVRLRDGRSRFPGTSTAAHLCDLDHAREWQHGGRTEAGNLITLDRRSHLMKSEGLWGDELLDTGIVGITDAWGHHFEDPPDQPVGPPPAHLQPDSSDDPDAPPPF